MKQFYGYIRVSTVKQGQQGVSLQEQRDAILRYASRSGLEIVSWFEEQETAAKRGRPVFNRMLKLLQHKKAHGVVFHKIDRGARNMKDWANIGELSDQGVDVHLASESLDMRSRGGRHSADIQAVVAADFIRNLREETRKGFYGRLKQGIYPLGAPLGYLNRGGGKTKDIDPIKGPLVRKAFELYSTGRYNLITLGETLHDLGLRNKRGNKLTKGGLAKILHNVFYIGLIHLRRSGETFSGAHSPLVSKSLFDRVQAILRGKTNTHVLRHDFLFRRLLHCGTCGGNLVGERQKGRNYYRCHTRTCPITSVREDAIQAAVQKQLEPLRFSPQELGYFRTKLTDLKTDWGNRQGEECKALELRIAQQRDRLNRLTDALLDGLIERDLFEQRKTTLLMELRGLEENMANLRGNYHTLPDRLSEFLELTSTAWLSYRAGNADEKRDLLKIVTSNREVIGKNVMVKLSFPFSEVAKRPDVSSCALDRTIPRTFEHLKNIMARLISEGRCPTFQVGFNSDS